MWSKSIAGMQVKVRAVADRFKEPGPAATGIPLPRHARPDELIKLDIVAMLGQDGAHLERQHIWPSGHWDWPVHLPYKHGLKCGNMIFIGGQVPLDGKGEVIKAGQAAAQTRMSLEYISKVLSGFGLGMDSVVKVLTLYSGSGKHDELHTNLEIRSAAFTDPGPATTGIPVPCLAYEQMTIEIEVIAMSE
jgi:enamine deaminase RidA (YjgF/YER057c/UK114 family)